MQQSRSRFSLLALAASVALAAGCSSSPGGTDALACDLPSGMECCYGGRVGTFNCDSSGNAVCLNGAQLTPSNECTLDAGNDAADANTCALPAGFECCDGDVLGMWSCGTDGGVVCEQGTRLTPSNECTIAPPFDAGNDTGVDAAIDAAHD